MTQANQSLEMDKKKCFNWRTEILKSTNSMTCCPLGWKLPRQVWSMTTVWEQSLIARFLTAINMLTLGIRRTCIILRHIRSWFEAVLTLANLQSYAQGVQKGPLWAKNAQIWQGCWSPKVVYEGQKWSKMTNTTYFWPFGAILGRFGLFLVISHITLVFAPNHFCQEALCVL